MSVSDLRPINAHHRYYSKPVRPYRPGRMYAMLSSVLLMAASSSGFSSTPGISRVSAISGPIEHRNASSSTDRAPDTLHWLPSCCISWPPMRCRLSPSSDRWAAAFEGVHCETMIWSLRSVGGVGGAGGAVAAAAGSCSWRIRVRHWRFSALRSFIHIRLRRRGRRCGDCWRFCEAHSEKAVDSVWWLSIGRSDGGAGCWAPCS